MMNTLVSRRAFLGASAGALGCAATVRWASAAEKALPPLAFYAMDTGLRGPDVPMLEDKVRLLHDLGYWGIDYTLNPAELPRLLKLLERYDIELACVYLSPILEQPIDSRFVDAIKLIQGRPTRIELAIQSKKYKPSDPAGDGQAMDLIRRFSDVAADHGPVVSIYPHTGSWAQRVQDGVRLAEKSGRKNVGSNFNLVHWKWVKQDQPMEQALRQSLPKLFAVSINGLDGSKIVPLDQGNYDVTGFMRLLTRLGYRGPIGFQGYGIPGASRQILDRTMHARFSQCHRK